MSDIETKQTTADSNRDLGAPDSRAVVEHLTDANVDVISPEDLKSWLYEHKSKGGNSESQLWLVLKFPLLIAFVGCLLYQFLAAWWITGTPYGIGVLVLVEVCVIVHYYRKARKGTEQDKQEKIVRELAKTKSL